MGVLLDKLLAILVILITLFEDSLSTFEKVVVMLVVAVASILSDIKNILKKNLEN